MNNKALLRQLTELKDASELTGSLAAEITKWLLLHEAQPGGPYVPKGFNQTQTLLLNYHAVRLFSSAQHPLEGALQYLQDAAYSIPPLTHSTMNIPIYNEVEKFVHAKFPAFQQSITPVIAKLQSTDVSGEISQLSALFMASVGTHSITQKALKTLDRANIFTWLAYSLYDKVHDEAGHTLLNPAANCMARESIFLYSQAGVPTELTRYYFTKTDNAALRELAYCRFEPDQAVAKSRIPSQKILKELLSERSIVHCLGPLSIAKKALTSTQYRHFASICRSYCQVRQLLDDIHDWRQDFSEGKWTYVTAYLARSVHTPHTPTYSLLESMKHAFWNNGAATLLDEALQTLLSAESQFIQHIGGKDTPFMNATLYPLKNAILKGRQHLIATKTMIENLSQE